MSSVTTGRYLRLCRQFYAAYPQIRKSLISKLLRPSHERQAAEPSLPASLLELCRTGRDMCPSTGLPSTPLRIYDRASKAARACRTPNYINGQAVAVYTSALSVSSVARNVVGGPAADAPGVAFA